MKVAVIGAGGVGAYFGGRLAQSGVDTTFLVRGRTLEALRKSGLRVDSVKGDFVLPKPRATDDPGAVPPVDVVLVATKAWQVREAGEAARRMLAPGGVVVPLQNGIDAPDVLAEVVGSDHVAGGLCAIVSFIVEPGHVRHAGADPMIMFGELDGRESGRLLALRDAFRAAGITADVPQDIRRSMWTKLLFIAVMSGMGALTRVPVGAWRTTSESRRLAEGVLREIIAVAGAQGVSLADDAVPATMARYDGLPPESTSSLQRDMAAGRPSELDAQLGAIVRLARAGGVATPLLDSMHALLLPSEQIARSSETQ